MMASSIQALEHRLQLRGDIYEYITHRAEEPRFHDLLLACSELSLEELEEYRASTASGHECGDGGDGDGLLVVADENSSAVAGESAAKQPLTEEMRNALQWATSVNDDAIIEGLASELPLAVQQEQLALYEKRHGPIAVADESNTKQIVVYPHFM